MPRLSPEELAMRRSFLGASEIPAICGMGPFPDSALKVWLEKTGRAEERPADENGQPVDIGHEMEEHIIVPWYERTRGVTCEKVSTVVHPEIPWLAASPDRLIVGTKKALEVKNVGHRMMARWPDPQIPGGIPPEYVVGQCQIQGFVLNETGRETEAVDVAAMLGGKDLCIFEVTYDPSLALAMVELAEAWWQTYVVGDVQPDIGAGETARKRIASLFPKTTKPRFRAPDSVDARASRLAFARLLVDHIEEEKEKIENEIKVAIGEAEGVTGLWGSISWKHNKDSVKIDWEAAAREVHTGWALGTEAQALAAIVARHTTITEGKRPFKPNFSREFTAQIELQLQAALGAEQMRLLSAAQEG